MSRSYHVTRKKANRAMNAGDMDPTWQASEKAWVKEKTKEKRVLESKLKSGRKTPNRSIVATEKERTARAKGHKPSLDGVLDKMLAEEEPNQPIQRNASTGSVSKLESPARRG